MMEIRKCIEKMQVFSVYPVLDELQTQKADRKVIIVTACRCFFSASPNAFRRTRALGYVNLCMVKMFLCQTQK